MLLTPCDEDLNSIVHLSLMHMDKEGARFQTLERLHEQRKQVVRLHRKEVGVMRIVELSGLSCPTVRGIIDRYEQCGAETIKPAPRSRQSGEGRYLRLHRVVL